MSTIINFSNHKMDNAPVFGQLAVGQWLIFEDTLFCKTGEVLSGTVSDRYNVFAPSYGFDYLEASDAVELVEEINIQILK